MAQNSQQPTTPEKVSVNNGSIARLLVVALGISLMLAGAVYARNVAIQTGAVSSKTGQQRDVNATRATVASPGTEQEPVTPSPQDTMPSALSGGTDGTAGPTVTEVQPAEKIPDAPDRKQPGATIQPAPSGGMLHGAVVGISQDGKALRIHIAGAISGMPMGAAAIVVSFYNPDKTPMPVRDATSSSGEPFRVSAQFQVISDPATIDLVVEAPLEQFTSMAGATFRCKAISGDKEYGESEPFPIVAATAGTKANSDSTAGKKDP
jgi:hypothetical protein